MFILLLILFTTESTKHSLRKNAHVFIVSCEFKYWKFVKSMPGFQFEIISENKNTLREYKTKQTPFNKLALLIYINEYLSLSTVSVALPIINIDGVI